MANLLFPVSLNAFSQQYTVLTSEATKLDAARAFPVPNPTVSFWQRDLDILPSLTEGSEGPIPDGVDIVIIGSGISGVGAAYHLAKQFGHEGPDSMPIKAVILDTREFC